MPSWWALLPKAQSATKAVTQQTLSEFEMVISGVDSHARSLENTHMRSSVVIRKRAI